MVITRIVVNVVVETDVEGRVGKNQGGNALRQSMHALDAVLAKNALRSMP